MKDCTMHRHPRKWRQRGKWVTASVPSDSDASIVANRPWKPAKSRDIPLLRSSLLSLLSLEKKYPLLRSDCSPRHGTAAGANEASARRAPQLCRRGCMHVSSYARIV